MASFGWHKNQKAHTPASVQHSKPIRYVTHLGPWREGKKSWPLHHIGVAQAKRCRCCIKHKCQQRCSKKGGDRVRKGWSTDGNRTPLNERVNNIEPAGANYNVQLTGPLQATFTQSQPVIQRTPPKPRCPPTLGEPFLVKPVAGTNIRICFGCSGSLGKADMCVAHNSHIHFTTGSRSSG